MSRYVLLPFHGPPLLLVGVFTILLLIALKAGFLGIPLGAILISWFFKYCFILLDAIVAGDDEAPVLSAEMVNPLSEQRPLAQTMLIVLASMLVYTLGSNVGKAVAIVVGVGLLLALPASIAVLGVTRNLFRAASPASIAAMVRGLRLDYVWVTIAALALAGIVVGLSATGMPLWVMLAATQWAFLLTFSLIAGAVHEHRDDLGIVTLTRRERMDARDLRDHIKERRKMLDEAYGQLRLRRSRDSWDLIDKWLEPHRGRDSERAEYLAVLEASSQWDDPAIADRLTCDYLAVLLAKRENSAALFILEQRLRTNPKFQLRDPIQTTRLAELAALSGKRSLRRFLEPKP